MQTNVVLLGQFQTSNTGSRTKATLALSALAAQSCVCHGMNTYPEDFSLSCLHPGGFCQRLRKSGDTVCLQIILKEVHT